MVLILHSNVGGTTEMPFLHISRSTPSVSRFTFVGSLQNPKKDAVKAARQAKGEQNYLRMHVCVCVRACVRACVCV